MKLTLGSNLHLILSASIISRKKIYKKFNSFEHYTEKFDAEISQFRLSSFELQQIESSSQCMSKINRDLLDLFEKNKKCFKIRISAQ